MKAEVKELFQWVGMVVLKLTRTLSWLFLVSLRNTNVSFFICGTFTDLFILCIDDVHFSQIYAEVSEYKDFSSKVVLIEQSLSFVEAKTNTFNTGFYSL